MSVQAGNLKKGEFITYQNDIWQVQKTEFYSPGKGSALMRSKLKNVKSGKTIDYSFKSNETIENLDVTSHEMQFLYKNNEVAVFMDNQTFAQFELTLDLIGPVVNFFVEGMSVFVYLHDETPLNVRSPASVNLKIVQTEDAAKGDTVSNARKEAITETGATVMVPLFIKTGDTISVNPETAQYSGRV